PFCTYANATRPDHHSFPTRRSSDLGDNGMGHLAVSYAANLAVEIARESGVAWVGVRRSNHAGAGSTYACIPVAHGMVGIYSAVRSEEHTSELQSRENLVCRLLLEKK